MALLRHQCCSVLRLPAPIPLAPSSQFPRSIKPDHPNRPRAHGMVLVKGYGMWMPPSSRWTMRIRREIDRPIVLNGGAVAFDSQARKRLELSPNTIAKSRSDGIGCALRPRNCDRTGWRRQCRGSAARAFTVKMFCDGPTVPGASSPRRFESQALTHLAIECHRSAIRSGNWAAVPKQGQSRLPPIPLAH
jgi:hypothetical protein